MLKNKYIAIEGPIGVGKTSLAEILSSKLETGLFLESVEENPFVTDFYRDMKKYAFQTQLFFLLSRYHHQQDLLQMDIFKRGIISDYIFDKDRLFANLTLEDTELKLYEQIHNILKVQILKPDLVIFLQASTDVLLKRIELRGRKFEKKIKADYLDELNKAYNYYFFHYRDTPLMVINTSDIDFVHRDADLDDLLLHLEKMGKGTVYYQPISLQKGSKLHAE
jgi:deoxyadenosine/deoxycytidine kinase